MAKERWLPIAGYEGLYEVSDFGNVRSLDRVVPTHYGTRVHRGKQLLPTCTNKGYSRVGLSRDGTTKLFVIHRLVCAAFLPPDPERPHVNHLDLDRTNNRVTNLEWCTQLENFAHSSKHGSNHAATNPNKAKKLTARQVEAIHVLDELGTSVRIISSLFSITKDNVRNILSGKLWAALHPKNKVGLDR